MLVKIQVSQIKFRDKSISDFDSDSRSNIVTYFRHPIKGNMRVDSFNTAIEVFRYLSAISDPRAKLWKDLAFLILDAPTK